MYIYIYIYMINICIQYAQFRKVNPGPLEASRTDVSFAPYGLGSRSKRSRATLRITDRDTKRSSLCLFKKQPGHTWPRLSLFPISFQFGLCIQSCTGGHRLSLSLSLSVDPGIKRYPSLWYEWMRNQCRIVMNVAEKWKSPQSWHITSYYIPVPGF